MLLYLRSVTSAPDMCRAILPPLTIYSVMCATCTSGVTCICHTYGLDPRTWYMEAVSDSLVQLSSRLPWSAFHHLGALSPLPFPKPLSGLHVLCLYRCYPIRIPKHITPPVPRMPQTEFGRELSGFVTYSDVSSTCPTPFP